MRPLLFGKTARKKLYLTVWYGYLQEFYIPVGDFLSFRRETFTIILNGDDCDRGNGICKTFTTFHAARLWSKNKRYNGFTVIR